ncbi:MAG: hypothetical protein H6709_03480 [Kofleriaceae bacterium]|nr:hypothetical protein [Kofleriaceae bacterium]
MRDAWRTTLGRPPEERIATWNAWLRGHADNRHAAAVRAEVASLQRQLDALARAAATQPEDRAVLRARALAALDPAARGGLLAAAPATHARADEPLALALLVIDPGRASRAWLYARSVGQDGFRRLPLRGDGDGYLRGEVPADLVVPPGVEWFVEASSADGAPDEAYGSRAAPVRVQVDDARDPATAQPGRSRVSLALDYVDFDGGLGAGWDQYRQAELDFTYRFERPIYSMRLGLGTLDGVGGPKDVIDEDATGTCTDRDGNHRCRRLAFTYVYAEAELRLRPNVAVMLRPQYGRLTFDDRGDGQPDDCLQGELAAGCDVTHGGGVRARLRLGPETGTNLLLGAAFTSQVGTLLEAAYSWAPHPQVPVLLAVQVTDLPIPEDFGVRILGDVGWRKLAWVYPSLRLSYQARDVDHAGFSGGLGLNFDW